MVFIEDLKDKLFGELNGGKVILFDGGVYVEGHKGIAEISEECIIFRLKKKRLILSGEGFRLTCISHDSASVKGSLSALRFE